MKFKSLQINSFVITIQTPIDNTILNKNFHLLSTYYSPLIRNENWFRKIKLNYQMNVKKILFYLNLFEEERFVELEQ